MIERILIHVQPLGLYHSAPGCGLTSQEYAFRYTRGEAEAIIGDTPTPLVMEIELNDCND